VLPTYLDDTHPWLDYGSEVKLVNIEILALSPQSAVPTINNKIPE
jgi:hypothetical protein